MPLIHKARGACYRSFTAIFTPGQEFVEFFIANILLRLHAEVEDVFPAGRRLQAVSG